MKAKAEGVNNTEDMIEKTIEHLKTMMPEGKTSMLQDVEAGRKTEVDMFAGTIVTLGEKHGIPTPCNKVLKEMIEIIHEHQDIKRNSKECNGNCKNNSAQNYYQCRLKSFC